MFVSGCLKLSCIFQWQRFRYALSIGISGTKHFQAAIILLCFLNKCVGWTPLFPGAPNWTKNWDMEIWNSSMAKIDTWNKKLTMRPDYCFQHFCYSKPYCPWAGCFVWLHRIIKKLSWHDLKHSPSPIWIAAFGDDVELLKSVNWQLLSFHIWLFGDLDIRSNMLSLQVHSKTTSILCACSLRYSMCCYTVDTMYSMLLCI